VGDAAARICFWRSRSRINRYYGPSAGAISAAGDNARLAERKSRRASRKPHCQRDAAIASSLDPAHLSLVNEFAMLLDDRAARGWVAHHLVELLKVTGTHQVKALGFIDELANGSGLDSVGERVWLDKWHSGGAT
jgi:hypothetical protein